MTTFCPHCGTQREPDWKYCRRCGSPQAKEPRESDRAFCTECGSMIDDQWEFCAGCAAPTPIRRERKTPRITRADQAAYAEESVRALRGEPPPPSGIELEPPPVPDAPPVPSASPPPIPAPPEADSAPPPPTSTPPGTDWAPSPPATAPPGTDSTSSPPSAAPPWAPMEPVSPPPPGYAPDEAEPAAASALGAPLRDAPGAEPPGAEPPSTPRYGDVAAAPAAGPPAWLGPTTERAEIEPLGDEPIEDMESDQALDELADDQVAAVTLDPDEVEEGATATLISPRTVDAEVVPTLRPGQPVDLPEKTDEDLDAGVATEPAVFRPVRALGVWTQLSWLIVGLLAIATIAGLIVLNARLDDFRAGGSFDDVVAAKDVIDIWLRIVLGVALVAALGLTVVWWYRIYRNQAYLGEELLRPSPWLALAAWLVPIVNLVAPPVLLHRAWRRAVSDEEATQINWWIALWWICLVAFGAVVLTVGLAAGDATTVEASLDANTYAAIAYGLLIGSSLAAVGVVSSVSERQTERATHATRAGMTPALVR